MQQQPQYIVNLASDLGLSISDMQSTLSFLLRRRARRKAEQAKSR